MAIRHCRVLRDEFKALQLVIARTLIIRDRNWEIDNNFFKNCWAGISTSLWGDGDFLGKLEIRGAEIK